MSLLWEQVIEPMDMVLRVLVIPMTVKAEGRR